MSKSSRSENSGYSTPRPRYNHGSCYLQRSLAPYNPGRRFWRCPLGDKGDCGYFVSYEDPFEGMAKMALLDCIRKSNMRLQKEKMGDDEKIEELKDSLEAKIKRVRAENKLLKQALKDMK